MSKTFLRTKHRIIALLLMVPALAAWADTPNTDYTLDIRIEPATHELEIEADIILPAVNQGQALEFLLSNGGTG